MKLADLSSGPDWVVWIVFVIFAEKKLCRTMGIGMSIISILILIMGLFESVLPAFFVYIAVGIIVVDVVVIIILGNTLCRK